MLNPLLESQDGPFVAATIRWVGSCSGSWQHSSVTCWRRLLSRHSAYGGDLWFPDWASAIQEYSLSTVCVIVACNMQTPDHYRVARLMTGKVRISIRWFSSGIISYLRLPRHMRGAPGHVMFGFWMFILIIVTYYRCVYKLYI